MRISTKTYGHEVGLSSCFRQWRAESHCKRLHGYALSVFFEFAAMDVDENQWVVDFGGMKSLKQWLQDTFDHTLLVADDDPQKFTLMSLDRMQLAKVVIVPNTGCEAFAKLIYEYSDNWLQSNGYKPRVHLRRVDVREHGANSGAYEPLTLSL